MRPYLVEKVLPIQTVHLLGGPSGAGKSRILFQWFEDLSVGNSILGLHVPAPVRLGYVCLDRSLDSILETFECLNIDPTKIPNFEYLSCADRLINLVQIPSLFKSVPDLLVIDGIPALLPTGDINKYTEVSTFMRLCLKICEQSKTTILGLLHCTKTKENERYLNPRQRISGSVAWAAFSETIFLLEPIKPDNPNDDRSTLTVLPRNAKRFTRDYTFDDKGRLVEYSVQEEKDKYSLLLQLIPCDQPITRDHIIDLAFNLGIGRSQADAWVKECIENGLIIKPSYGLYLRKKPN